MADPHRDTLELRRPRPGDETAWRQLWRGYCAFYEHVVPEETTAATWLRILSADETFRCVLACRGDVVVGFANLIIHPITWSPAPACYLEDLFVDPDARGQGVGRALIAHLVDQARSEGWSRVYWMTQADNATARVLYDTFVPADDFVRYVIHLDES
jgi:GNAT superfamily N-acetyltransferase